MKYPPISKIPFCLIGVMCFIACNSDQPDQPIIQSDLTFTDVAPIFENKCLDCHHASGAGPFPLTNYQEIKRKIKTIQKVIIDGYMPPWKADTAYSRFAGERVLNKSEKEKILEWIAGGAVDGDDHIQFETDREAYYMHFGKPDLELQLDAIQLSGNNKDHFFLAKIPIKIPRDTFVRAVLVLPDNKKLLHHADAQMVVFENEARLNVDEGKNIFNVNWSDNYLSAFTEMGLKNDDGTFPALIPAVTHYLPGAEYFAYPKGIGGFKIKKKSALLFNQLHYGPSGKQAVDRSKVLIYYGDTPPDRPIKEIVLGSGGMGQINPELIIPANTKKKFTIRYKLPKKITALTLNPHMHLLGASFKAYAIYETDTIPLISIPQWDFRWQNFYTFRKAIVLKKGAEIIAEGWFDNTSDNPFNPNSPPVLVDGLKGSMKSTDEMLQFSIDYIEYKIGDEKLSLTSDPVQ